MEHGTLTPCVLHFLFQWGGGGGGRGSCSSCLQQIGIPSQSEPANIQHHKGLDPMMPERLPPSVSNHVPKTFEINLPLLQTFQLMSLPGKVNNLHLSACYTYVIVHHHHTVQVATCAYLCAN